MRLRYLRSPSQPKKEPLTTHFLPLVRSLPKSVGGSSHCPSGRVDGDAAHELTASSRREGPGDLEVQTSREFRPGAAAPRACSRWREDCLRCQNSRAVNPAGTQRPPPHPPPLRRPPAPKAPLHLGFAESGRRHALDLRPAVLRFHEIPWAARTRQITSRRCPRQSDRRIPTRARALPPPSTRLTCSTPRRARFARPRNVDKGDRRRSVGGGGHGEGKEGEMARRRGWGAHGKGPDGGGGGVSRLRMLFSLPLLYPPARGCFCSTIRSGSRTRCSACSTRSGAELLETIGGHPPRPTPVEFEAASSGRSLEHPGPRAMVARCGRSCVAPRRRRRSRRKSPPHVPVHTVSSPTASKCPEALSRIELVRHARSRRFRRALMVAATLGAVRIDAHRAVDRMCFYRGGSSSASSHGTGVPNFALALDPRVGSSSSRISARRSETPTCFAAQARASITLSPPRARSSPRCAVARYRERVKIRGGARDLGCASRPSSSGDALHQQHVR